MTCRSPPPVSRVPDALFVDILARYVSLATAAAACATNRRRHRDVAPAWRHEVRRRWLHPSRIGTLHPRERAALETSTWDAPALQVWLYRHGPWPYHVVRDLRIPRSLGHQVCRWMPRVATVSDVQFDLLQHVACDVWRHRPVTPLAVPLAVGTMCCRLPHVRLTFGPWSFVGPVLYRDGRYVAGMVVETCHRRSRFRTRTYRLWPTARYDASADAWIRTLAARPADGLLRFCTQCPFCGAKGGGGSHGGGSDDDGSDGDTVVRPTEACALEWASWASRWASWNRRRATVR